MRWSDLLGPLFPAGAEVALKPQLNSISVCWQPDVVFGQPKRPAQTVTIFIAPDALKEYRNAQDGQRARADRKLFSHVHSNLKRLRRSEPGRADPEHRIVVASGDILSR
jgi:hypothetical protein